MRFYIKNKDVVFILKPSEYRSEEDMKITADLTGAYDQYIDKDTDHPRWLFVNGTLQEDTNYNPQVAG